MAIFNFNRTTLIMKTKLLKSEQEYDAACKRIYVLIHKSEVAIDPDSPEGEEVELLSLLVEKFEKEHYPIFPKEGALIH
jgi:HTH-type transcriptional regulator/antitoxin HigA